MSIQNTDIDDYYSHIPATGENQETEKKSSLKLKIKAKKPEVEAVVEPPAAQKEEEPAIQERVHEAPKFKLKKQPQIITFEEKKIIPRHEPIENEGSSRTPERSERTEHTPIDGKPSIHAEKPTESEGAPKPKPPEVSIDSESLGRFSANKKKAGFFERRPAPKFPPKEPVPIDTEFSKKFKGKKGIRTKGSMGGDDDSRTFRRSKKSFAEKKYKNVDDIRQTLTDKTGQEVSLPEFLTVKEFSDKVGIPMSKVIGEFLKNGMMVNLNTRVDFETCFIIADLFNIKVMKEQQDKVSIASVIGGNIEDLLKNDDPMKKIRRAPIISIMGHVDHGKTSILDYIRKTHVAAGEAGGITQKIGAYQVEKNGNRITFLDTPGHEAFSIMRARGAKLTDIAIIVVAADEGIKPQTIESINHAKEAGVMIIVAVNKMDKPGANLDFVKGQLAEQGLQPEDWGGETVIVPVSALTGLGIDTLIEMILLVSEMLDLKADPKRPAIATVIESHLDSKLGSLATILVNAGTLKKSDYIVCASSYGRLRSLKDYKGRNIDEAGPSTPVLISGLSNVAEGGDVLQVVPDIDTAKQKAHEFEMAKASKSLNQFEGASLELLLNRIKTGNLKQLKVVVKAESNGSLEALKEALRKLSTAETKIQIIHSGVGDINDSDVIMAGTSQAILVGYNVGVVSNAKSTLQNSKIEFINKKVIYHILEKIESIITGMIDIRHDDVDIGEAKLKAIFFTSKDKMVLGCELKEGKVENKSKVRVIRNSKKVGSGEIISLKHGVVDVQEIEEGEFGIAFKGDVKVEEGDTLEFYKIVQRKGL